MDLGASVWLGFYQPDTAIALIKANTAKATKLNPIANRFFFLAFNNRKNPIAITIVKMIINGSNPENVLVLAFAASAAINIERPPLSYLVRLPVLLLC
jgi:hypothetical protein